MASKKSHRKTLRRRTFEIGIVLLVLASVILAMVFVRQPASRHDEWINPNKITSADLVEHPFQHNGTTIEFTGEAIGERMVRSELSGGGAWIHLNDDPYMYSNIGSGAPLSGYNSGIAVWVENAGLTDTIKYYGGHQVRGDSVKVVGVYNMACSLHGGDTDMHASSLEIVSPGGTSSIQVERWKLFVTPFLAVIALVMYLINRRRIRDELKGLFKRRSARDA